MLHDEDTQDAGGGPGLKSFSSDIWSRGGASGTFLDSDHTSDHSLYHGEEAPFFSKSSRFRLYNTGEEVVTWPLGGRSEFFSSQDVVGSSSSCDGGDIFPNWSYRHESMALPSNSCPGIDSNRGRANMVTRTLTVRIASRSNLRASNDKVAVYRVLPYYLTATEDELEAFVGPSVQGNREGSIEGCHQHGGRSDGDQAGNNKEHQSISKEMPKNAVNLNEANFRFLEYPGEGSGGQTCRAKRRRRHNPFLGGSKSTAEGSSNSYPSLPIEDPLPICGMEGSNKDAKGSGATNASPHGRHGSKNRTVEKDRLETAAYDQTGNRVAGVWYDTTRRLWRVMYVEGEKRKTKGFSPRDFGYFQARDMAVALKYEKLRRADHVNIDRRSRKP